MIVNTTPVTPLTASASSPLENVVLDKRALPELVSTELALELKYAVCESLTRSRAVRLVSETQLYATVMSVSC